MTATTQVQHFGEIRIEGSGQLTINQVVQIAVAEIKTRTFVPSSPYPGLRRFEELNKDFFFGRDRLIEQLLQLLLQRNLLLLAGASGSGKSSVVRAGLVPLLASRFAQRCFRVLVMTPDRDPFSSLRATLQMAGIAQSQLDGLDSCTADSFVSVLATVRPLDEQWLLFVDQFEEIFALCADGNARAEFLSGITQLAQQPQSDIKIALAMRADFFDRFGPYPTFGTLAQQGLQLVLDMEASELRAAIEQPGAKHGVVFETGLVEQIIDDVKGRPGALPLLQYTLDLLWRSDNPHDDRTLNTTSYHKIGGIEGALRLRADAIYQFEDAQRQTPRGKEQQELIRQIFLRVVDLTSQGTEARVVSRRAALADFSRAEEQQLIQELADEKLLVTNALRPDPGSSAVSTVEIAHEALLSAWPLLKEWIEQAREVIYVRNRLSADARRWVNVKTDQPHLAADELWSGTRLQQALELHARGDFATVLGGLTPQDEAFLDSSVQVRERRMQEEQVRQEHLRRLELDAESAKLQAEKEQAEREKAQAEREKAQAEREKAQAEREKAQALADAEKAERARASVAAQAKMRSRTQRLLLLIVATLVPALIGVYFQYRRAKHEEEDKAQALAREKVEHKKAERLIQAGIGAHAKSLTQQLGDVEALRRGLLAVGPALVEREEPPEGAVEGLITAAQARGYPLLPPWRHEHEKYVNSASFSPDGAQVVTASADGTARLWDANTGAALATLKGHTESVLAASFSPDGTWVVTASADGTARLWDANTGAALATLKGHTKSVHAASFSPDGARVVTASADGTARLWDGKTGTALVTFKGHTEEVRAASFSPDGARVVTASYDRTARLWNANTGVTLATLKGHIWPVHAASFSPDGARVVTTSSDETARLWDGKTGAPLATLKGHGRDVRAASFSPDGERVVTASDDGTARLWHGKTGAPLATLTGHYGWVRAVSFSPDGAWVLTAGADRTARLWDGKTGTAMTTLTGHTDAVLTASFSPDGARIVTGSWDRTARLWNAKLSSAVATLKGHTSSVRVASFSPDGARVLTASWDHTARLWDAKTGSTLALKRHTAYVVAASFSPDGGRMVTASWDHTARLWDAKTGAPLATLKGHRSSVLAASFSPDGTRLVTGSADHTARLWDGKTGAPLATLTGHTESVQDASFSPDGTRVVTASDDGTSRLWDAQTGAPLATLKGHTQEVLTASFSPDGTRVVTASPDRTARLWDGKTGAPLATLQKHTTFVHSAGFSPDGARVVTTSSDHTARLWDGKTGAPLATLKGHTDPVRAASFSPDGARVVTTSDDRTTRLWDGKTGAPLATFVDPQGSASRVAFSPDGSQVVTAGTDGMVFIYSTQLMHYVTRACELLRGHPDEFQQVANICKLAEVGR